MPTCILFVHNFCQSHALAINVLNVVHLLACMLSVAFSIVDGRVNNVLLQTVSDVSEALIQFIVHTTFMHSLLHNTPEFIIH